MKTQKLTINTYFPPTKMTYHYNGGSLNMSLTRKKLMHKLTTENACLFWRSQYFFLTHAAQTLGREGPQLIHIPLVRFSFLVTTARFLPSSCRKISTFLLSEKWFCFFVVSRDELICSSTTAWTPTCFADAISNHRKEMNKTDKQGLLVLVHM